MNQIKPISAEGKKTFQNLLTRTLTGAFLVAVIIASMIWHPLAFSAVAWALTIIGLTEFYRLTDYHEIKPNRLIGYSISSAVFALIVLVAANFLPARLLVFIPFLVSLFFIGELFRNRQESVLNLAFSIFPVIYITIPMALLAFIMSPDITGTSPHWHLLFGYFIILWTHDTFAYLTGLATGKHKLWESISPKKTWEGSLGGLIFALIAAYVLSLFFTGLTAWQWLGAAVIICITGTLGDLSESLLKRRFNVKDSGAVFPGHGGVLDRFDAVLFSAPALLCYLILIRL